MAWWTRLFGAAAAILQKSLRVPAVSSVACGRSSEVRALSRHGRYSCAPLRVRPSAGYPMRLLAIIGAAVIGSLVGIITGYANFIWSSHVRPTFFVWLADSATQDLHDAILWALVGALVGMGLWYSWTLARDSGEES